MTVTSTPSLLTANDLHLFNEGTHQRMFDRLGAHPIVVDGKAGTIFGVWAPNARHVSVVGDWNRWDAEANPLYSQQQSGIWECFVPKVGKGALYKFRIVSHVGNQVSEKTDPYGVFCEVAPKTASIVWDLDYPWRDRAWMRNRAQTNGLNAPISIYEVHLGSWRRKAEDGNSLSYRELAPLLAEHVKATGFTHVELMPIMEHPFFGSWGYQVTGFFAPTSRFGTPQDFMYLVDHLHANGIGVILDWVPSHFPTDAHGLAAFDGTHLYEHADPRKGFHPDWNSLIFNYGRNEVQSFLISNALYWLDKYHVDGLRVDAVASMLYLDYSRKPGQWIPNQFGGNENIEAIDFLRKLNQAVYSNFPDVQMIAEESTAWPMVSRPTYVGGLGFGLKWDMGWMHDTLRYMSREPVHRTFHHQELTFRILYAFNENFVLSISHDEVVHGKGSLMGKLPGDDWQKAANLRLLFGYMMASPGKKLLFMGCEFGQWREWNHDSSLDWHLLGEPRHQQIQAWLSDLNRLYRKTPALFERDFDGSGFEWIDCNDAVQSVICWMRKDAQGRPIVCVFNLTPVPRANYSIGVPEGGRWKELLNSDAGCYGGSGVGNFGGVEALDRSVHGRPYSIDVTLPPLGVLFFAKDV